MPHQQPAAPSSHQHTEPHQPALFDSPGDGEQAELPLEIPAPQAIAQPVMTAADSATVTGPQPARIDWAQVPADPTVSWTEQPVATFDLETTGRDATSCRIVTASVLLVAADGTVFGEWEWLVNPGVEIPDGAAAIHGITTEHAQENGVAATTAVAQILDLMGELFSHGIPVLAFNAAYDFTVLEAEARRHGLRSPQPRPVLDPYVLHKHVRERWRGKRTLVALSEAYGISLLSAHTSAADALAAVQLAQLLAREHPDLEVPAESLHQSQIGWSQEQAASFQEHLRGKKNDPTLVINGDWPLRQ